MRIPGGAIPGSNGRGDIKYKPRRQQGRSEGVSVEGRQTGGVEPQGAHIRRLHVSRLMTKLAFCEGDT